MSKLFLQNGRFPGCAPPVLCKPLLNPEYISSMCEKGRDGSSSETHSSSTVTYCDGEAFERCYKERKKKTVP